MLFKTKTKKILEYNIHQEKLDTAIHSYFEINFKDIYYIVSCLKHSMLGYQYEIYNNAIKHREYFFKNKDLIKKYFRRI